MAAAAILLVSCGGGEANSLDTGAASAPAAAAVRPVENHGKMMASDGVIRLMTQYYRPSNNQQLVAAIDGAAMSRADYVRDVAEIPGYHDAQAFQRKPKSDQVGPVARVYVVPSDYKDFSNWQMAAVVDVDPFPSGSAAADYSAYSNLGIEMSETAETYCVWLKGTAPSFQAILTRDNGTDCPNAGTLPPTTTWLNVGPETISGSTEADYPITARFNDDRKDGPTIGVKCGATYWCEIGYEKVTPRPPYGSHGSNRPEKFKPWHDEQRISIKDGTGFKRTHRASLVPTYNLADLRIKPNFTAANGAEVATIRLSEPLAGKYDAWGLEFGDNVVKLFAEEKPTGSGRYIWWATITPPSGPNGRKFKVDPAYHRTLPPGTARWVWNPNDEDIWIACDLGCCIVRGEGFSLASAVSVAAPVRSASTKAGSRPGG